MLRNLSFARQILPAFALIGVAIAAWLILVGLPDRRSESWRTARAWQARGSSSLRAR
jgi:hypothetical protein